MKKVIWEMRMKKMLRLAAMLLLAVLVMLTAATIPAAAAAKDWAGYDCVVYAKARFSEYWGSNLHATGIYNGYYGAQGYYYNAAANGDTVSSTPKPGCLAVWGDSTYGHVGFVEQVNDGSVYISEGGFNGAYHEGWNSLSSMHRSWKGGSQTFLGFVYIKGTLSPDPPTPPAEQPVDIGADFYAYIINTKHWKHATNDGKNVDSRTETGRCNQVWRFQRQPDGSYKIISAYDGRCLDVTGALAAAGTNVGVYDDNGNDAQRWYIYGSPGAYVLKPKCSDCVLDLADNSGEDGANLQIYTRNNSEAQFFAIWNLDLTAAPSLSVSGGQDGREVHFDWNAVLGAGSYTVWIWKGPDGDGNASHISDPVYAPEFGYGVFLEPGHYEAHVEAYNAFGSRMSNVVSFTVTAPPAVKGDLTGDGAVNVSDVMAACRVLARQSVGGKPTGEETARGDLNGDGNITITDVMLLCKILASRP